MPETLYLAVAYFIIGASLLTLIVMLFFFMRDAVWQVPRFGVVLKYLGFTIAAGLLFLGASMLVSWWPIRILGITLTGFPLIIILYVSGGFIKESIKMPNAISVAVLGSLGGLVLGIFLLVIRKLVESPLLF
ncbi:hypothetical protein HYW18_03110 [Candidatus Uhrbacteria bacterium]|nr:hypothetical protein [Candidatus Uhrbacteria bacterium]